VQVSVIGDPDDTVVVAVRGNLDHGSATVLGTTLDQVLDRPAPRVVVDVSGIGFCDPSGCARS
jgi:anti-sigma B factor antagonist